MQQFYLPVKIIMGLGCFSQLGEATSNLGKKALLACGQQSLGRAGILDRALIALDKTGVQTVLYDAIAGEPTLAVVQSAVDLARREKVQVVVGIGGGSAMDVAKATALLCTQPGSVAEHHRGRAITESGLPCIVVPTTAGTGTEATNNAVVTDTERGTKSSIRSPNLFATVALLDPELTVSMPPEVTASSGADALCQAIEAYTAQGAQPPTDALSGQAIQWIGRSLVRAYQNGSDIAARSNVLYGSLLAGMAMTNTRLGGAHGLAHPLGLRYHIPHGVICGLLLPYVMEYSLETAPGKYAEVARLLGMETSGLDVRAAAQRAAEKVRDILEAVRIPLHLSEFGVRREDLPEVIAKSMTSSNLKNNARILGVEDLAVLLERAM